MAIWLDRVIRLRTLHCNAEQVVCLQKETSGRNSHFEAQSSYSPWLRVIKFLWKMWFLVVAN